jgi:hypothetical protein
MADLFDSYLADTLKLTKSMVIKFDIQNKKINKRLKELGRPVDDNDPYSWKYNLNLAGLYHSNDPRIVISSNDTQEEIFFDKATLVNHPRTKVDYAIGNEDYYNALIAEYPYHQILINSITRDISLEQAVNARDFEILDWDKSLVASNEDDLIPEVQKWIDGFVARWWNEGFSVTETYYPATFILCLAMQLPMVVMNIRKEKARTNQASQFHIWSYLAGHYNIDKYRNTLSLSKAMWLYFNVLHLRKNAGTQHSLKQIVDEIVSGTNLELRRFILEQDDTRLQDENVRDIYFTTTDLEGKDKSPSRQAVPAVLEKTFDLALANQREFDNDLAILREKGNYNKYDNIPTRLIEVNQITASVTQSVDFFRLRWKYLIYLAHLGVYNPIWEIKLPNGRTRNLTTQDTIILYYYAQTQLDGAKMTTVPQVTVDGVFAKAWPGFNTIRNTTSEVITNDQINDILSREINFLSISSLDELDEFLKQKMITLNRFEYRAEGQPTGMGRASYENVVNALMVTEDCDLGPPGLMIEDWLRTVQINRYDFTNADWGDLIEEIITKLIGDVREGGELPAEQQDIINLFNDLTSYRLRTVTGRVAGRTQRIEIANIYYDIQKVTSRYQYDVKNDIDMGIVSSRHRTVHDINVAQDFVWMTKNRKQFAVDIGSNISFWRKGRKQEISLETPSPDFTFDE